MSTNIVILEGFLGSDPELRYTPSGREVVNLSLATNQRWNGADGQVQERTEWHTIEAWGNTAIACANSLHKGSRALAVGELRYDVKQQPDGTNRKYAKVVAKNVKFLDPAPDNGQPVTEAAPAQLQPEEIPF